MARDAAQVADLTDRIPAPATEIRNGLSWPASMRVIARREIPHPGAQPITTAGGSPALPRTPPPPRPRPAARRVGRCPISRSDTANEPAPRTASAASKTPAYATCPTTCSTRTESGSRSSPGKRPPGLDPDPGLQPRPTSTPMGTQNLPVQDPRRRRTHHPRTKPAKTPPRRGLALEPPPRHRLRQSRTPYMNGREPAALHTR